MYTLYYEYKDIRLFKYNISDLNLIWHRDQEDRIIIPLTNTNWKFQIDNKLPIKLQQYKYVFIQKGVYHRLIKGTSNLYIRLIKI